MLRRKRAVFAPTDGVLCVMDDLPARSERGADFSDVMDLVERFRLDFRTSRLRTEDVELAEADGVQITRKVTCRRAPGVDAGSTIAIDGWTYDVTRADLAARTMTLYLTRLATDGVATLVSTTSTRDERGEPVRSEGRTTVWVRRGAAGSSAGRSAGQEGPWPTLELTIRALDYDGETRVVRNGREYRIVRTRSAGDWVTLECEGGVAHGKRDV